MLNRIFLSGAIVVVLALGSTPVLAQSITTAQSVMFATEMTGNFVMRETEAWEFDHAGAKTFFTNAWNGLAPSIECEGNSADCVATNKPATPAAPAPDPYRLNPVAGRNACTFWAGGGLAGGTYTQTVFLNGKKGDGLWKFTYMYLITPTFSSVPPRTAWELQSSNDSAAVVTLSGYVAAQATQKASSTGKKKSDWTFKTSHTLLNGDGTARIASLQASLAWDGGQVGTLLAYALESGIDYFYRSNAGSNGPTGQLVDGGTVSAIQNGRVGSPRANFDDFAGNNGTLGDRAVLAPVSWAIPDAGQYTLTVSGTVKGVAGSLDQTFAVSKVISVSAGECSQ